MNFAIPVFRIGDQNALEVSAAVNRYVENKRTGLPEGIALTVFRDEAEVLNDRLPLMLGAAGGGFVLVFALLALFLDLRLACWVGFGIPIAFLGAVAVMPALGASINVISIFAFVLVLGIVVDDAIAAGSRPPGAAGVLRRRSPAHPARTRRPARDGALSARGAAVAYLILDDARQWA